MGSNQSAQSSSYQRPIPDLNDTADDSPPDDRHISISNKMVERLVEDATLAGEAAVAATTPSGKLDYKDKVYMEKIKCIDDTHSEKTGLTMENLQALAVRIDMRTANMVSVEPICAECKERVIQCYNEHAESEINFNCWDAVGAFTQCVQEASARRIQERTKRDALKLARRTRHVALAKEHELRDLNIPNEESTPA